MTAYSLGGWSGFSTIRDDAIAVELGDAEVAKMLRLLDLREDDARAALLPLEVLDRRRDRLLEDVVREHDEDAVAAREPLRQAQRVGDAALALLVGVREPVDPVRVPVAEQPEELAGVRAAGDEHELARSPPRRSPRSRR